LSPEKATAGFDALAETRQAEALERVQSWCQDSRRVRRVVSVFADLDGLAIFVLGADGRISARWEAKFSYLEWLNTRMDHWDDAVEAYDSERFSLVEQGVLGDIGSALWRALASLASGGDELVVLPHKAMRNLPLQHATLPNDARLSDLFERVFVYPTLWDFAECLRDGATAPRTETVGGCVDPAGNLPFARLEGWLCCDDGGLSCGSAVGWTTIKETARAADVLLLSCHGTFDALDPWNSALHVGSDDLNVMRFVAETDLPDVVVLGACGAGLNRRSASDEPVSFSCILLRRRVKAVIAPLWSVDDCASAVFMTLLFDQLGRDGDPARSVASAARALREMTAAQALERFDFWCATISGAGRGSLIDADRVIDRLSTMRTWLEGREADARPWSMLDWGAYQLVGGYSETG
jgi:hypothetical protein